MILSIDGKNLINVSSDDLQNGVFIVPVGVTHIEREAFRCMKYMIEVILPNTITYIDDWAFCGCTNLTKPQFEVLSLISNYRLLFIKQFERGQLQWFNSVCS